MGSSEQTWQTLSALPLAIIMFNEEQNRFYFNSLAQSLFSVEEYANLHDLNVDHLSLSDTHSSRLLSYDDFLPCAQKSKPLSITLANSKNNTLKLLDFKFASLSQSLFITICEPRTFKSH